MPPLSQLPRWLWARMGTPARAAAVIAALGLVAAAIVMAPRLADINRDNRAADRREAAQAEADRVRRIRELQRPRTVAVRASSRMSLRRSLERAIVKDSGARPGMSPVKRVECVGPPGRPTPEDDRDVRHGRYACTAVTADVANAGSSGRGFTGYPYRAVVDFQTGKATLCRVAGQAAEGFLDRRAVPVPAACTG